MGQTKRKTVFGRDLPIPIGAKFEKTVDIIFLAGIIEKQSFVSSKGSSYKSHRQHPDSLESGDERRISVTRLLDGRLDCQALSESLFLFPTIKEDAACPARITTIPPRRP